MNPTNRMLLGVNVDHVATVREARGTSYPDPVKAALEAARAGADAITVHLREDRRHIQERDVIGVKEQVDVRLNLELAVEPAVLKFAEQVVPQECCLVPERREELTTEGGLNVCANKALIADAVHRLTEIGSRVSLFIDPEIEQLEAAASVGASVVEIHTGAYADASLETVNHELERVRRAVIAGNELGLQVNAGHGLNYDNILPIASMVGITELNIGHAIVAQSMFDGMYEAVRKMLLLLTEGAALRGAGG